MTCTNRAPIRDSTSKQWIIIKETYLEQRTQAEATSLRVHDERYRLIRRIDKADTRVFFCLMLFIAHYFCAEHANRMDIK